AACEPALLTRLGADRFAAVVRADPSASGWLAEAARLAAAARADVDGAALGVSAGVAAQPEHGHDAATLLRRAEHALREAKRRGDGAVGVPSGGAAHTVEQLRQLADLRRAVCDP